MSSAEFAQREVKFKEPALETRLFVDQSLKSLRFVVNFVSKIPYNLAYWNSLWKHAYSNTCILKISPPKNENFQMKNSNIFRISDQNIECGYSLEPPQWGGSNEYPLSMFLSRNKKNNVYPFKPQFYYIKVRFKGVKSSRDVHYLSNVDLSPVRHSNMYEWSIIPLYV